MKRFIPFLGALVILAMTTTAFAAEWTGMILNKDGKLLLKTGNASYSITNPEKATSFEGQSVKVMGTMDKATYAVTIKSINSSAPKNSPSQKASL